MVCGMIAQMPRPLPAVLAALLAVPAGTQSAAYANVPTTPGPASRLTWDSTRGRLVALEVQPEPRLWDWDGAAWEPRLGAPTHGPELPFFTAYDAQRRVLITAAESANWFYIYVREWDGARWTVRQFPALTYLDARTPCAYDTHRRRLVAAADPDVIEWDGAQWFVHSPTPTPGFRSNAALGYDPVHQRTVLYGGVLYPNVLADCWAWDGGAWTQLSGNAPPGPRSGASLQFEPTTGRLLLYGGATGDTSTWALQGTTWTQVATSRNPGDRTDARWEWDGTGLLMHGGSATQGTEPWRFQTNDWVELPGGSPSPRWDAAFAWDAARGQAVAFGGYTGTQPPLTWFHDTWTYDGRWHHHQAATHPSARTNAAFAWSSPDNALLLFGGGDAISPLGDTWNWTGTNWLRRTPATSPPPRTAAAVAEDPAGGVLLFGGFDGVYYLGDQWHWDGVNWQLQTPAAPPGARAWAMATRDPLRNVVVLAGGHAGLSLLPETWEWDGAQWAQRAATPFTTGTRYERMCFRPDTGRVFVEGTGRWEWDGANWLTITATGAGLNGSRIAADPGRRRILRFPLFPDALGVWTSTPASVARYGVGCAIGPAPGITTVGRPKPGEAGFRVATATFAPGAWTLHAVGLAAIDQPLGRGCSLLVGTVLGTQFSAATAAGEASYGIALPPDPGLCGIPLYVQAAVFDPARALYQGVTISDGLRLTIGD
jgi:hypothetical protein